MYVFYLSSREPLQHFRFQNRALPVRSVPHCKKIPTSLYVTFFSLGDGFFESFPLRYAHTTRRYTHIVLAGFFRRHVSTDSNRRFHLEQELPFHNEGKQKLYVFMGSGRNTACWRPILRFGRAGGRGALTGRRDVTFPRDSDSVWMHAGTLQWIMTPPGCWADADSANPPWNVGSHGAKHSNLSSISIVSFNIKVIEASIEKKQKTNQTVIWLEKVFFN